MYYEYLLNELVTSNQVKLNLRRTIDKGLISSLNRLQEVKLALKYFGVDKNGNYTSDTDNIVNYRCPYSGEIGYNNLVLDHIIPVKSKGGTVLFNCIPVNKTINWNKHSNNLLTWWNNKSYFDYERLDRLVQYILEAYEIYDKEIIEEDDYIYEEENILEEQEELTKSITKEDIEEDKIDTNINESVTYYQFITNLIEKLSNDRNVDIYKERLLKLKEENKFGELTELDEIIKIVQKIIEEKIGNDNEISSSYSLNINIRKLYNSLKTKEYEKEIRERVNKIEEILKQENKPFTSYFKNLVDIEEYNILYFTSLDDNKINNFINSLKIDFDTKLELFIEMMAMDKYTDYKNGQPFGDNIFSQTNKVPFKGIKEEYGLNTATFWYRNQDKIIPRIEEKIEKLLNKDELTEEEKKELEKYNKAKQAYKTYEIINNQNLSARIDLFIEMMADEDYTKYENGQPNEHNIFSSYNKVPFIGVKKEYGLYVGHFWSNNQDKIIPRIEKKLEELSNKSELTEKDQKELEKYNKAKQAYKTYEIINQSNLIARIDLFIEMMAMDKYTDYKNGQPFGDNIFKIENEVSFLGTDKNVGTFWSSQQDKIIPRIEEKIEELSKKSELTGLEKKELEKYQKAKKAYKTYEIMNRDNISARIDLFIEMMTDEKEKYTSYKNGQPDESNIFSQRNKVPFLGIKEEYGLYVGQFWSNKQDEIISRIEEKIEELSKKSELTEEEQKELEKYEKAKQAYKTYEIMNRDNLSTRIDLFIEMMSMEKYTDYKNGKPNKDNIFKKDNEVPFLGIKEEYGLNTSNFWQTNSVKKIIPLLFFSDKYESSKYDAARDNTMKYLNYARRSKNKPEFNNIYEYILTLDAKKKEVKELIKLRDEKLEKKKQLIEENEELKNNNNVRRVI